MDTTIFTNILFSVLSIFIIFITIAFTLLTLSVAIFFKNINSFIKIILKKTEEAENGAGSLLSSIIYVASFIKNHWKKSKK